MLTNDRPPSDDEPKAKRPRLHWETRDVIRAINQRNDTHQALFGAQTPSNDCVKLINLMNVWPGGFCGSFAVTSPNFVTQGINAVSISNGLSNPGLPTTCTSILSPSSNPHTARFSLSSKHPMPPPPPEYSGYGYEIAILSNRLNRNHLRVLNWLLPAQVLHDAKIFDAVVKSPARCCLVNSIHLSDDITPSQTCSWLVAAPHDSLPLPAESELSGSGAGSSASEASSSDDSDLGGVRKKYKWFVASPLSDAQKTLLFAKGLDALFASGYTQIVSELPSLSGNSNGQKFKITPELSKIFDHVEEEISSKILTKEEEASLFSNLPYDHIVSRAYPQQVRKLTKYLDSFLEDDDDEDSENNRNENGEDCLLPGYRRNDNVCSCYSATRTPLVFAGDAVAKYSVFFNSFSLGPEIFPILVRSKLPHLSRMVLLPGDSTLGFNELCLKEAILAQNLTAVEYFLPKVYKHSSPDPENSFTFAHLAAGWGGPLVLKLFLQTFPTSIIRQQTRQGASILHLAVEAKDQQSVSVLLEHFPDLINVGDQAGATPLHIAVVTNQPELIVKLRKCGADENVVARGVTPVQLASVMGRIEAAEAFLCAL